jgi:hypothetical protein
MNDASYQADRGAVEVSQEPFSPKGPRSKWTGGSRWALFGCGGLVLLLGIASVVFLVKAKDLFGWMMGELETQIEQSLPANITESERQELSLAFDAVVDAVQEDRANAVALQDLQKLLRESLGNGPTRLSREEVRALIAALDRVSGRTPSDGFDPPGELPDGDSANDLSPSVLEAVH